MSAPPSRAWRTYDLPVFLGVLLFLALQYALALWRLTHSAGSMANKFSALAREEHLGFLIRENLRMLSAYGLLLIVGALLLQPFVVWWTRRSRRVSLGWVMGRAFICAALAHAYCRLRLLDTRPYFLTDAQFGHWYYRGFEAIPAGLRPSVFGILFTVLPILVIAFALGWHIQRCGRRGWLLASAFAALTGVAWVSLWMNQALPAVGATKPSSELPNILIIGSDSLRGDRLGIAGYQPQRREGPAAAGVSPTIDALARRSIRFEHCYTPIASTLESGTSLMSSLYPHSHGLRQMYPDRENVEKTKTTVRSIATLLAEAGYDTAAIGDWCAGYYELISLGFEHVSVSSFDNFKIYMSQAVVMAHSIVPLYFDHSIGYRLFPELGSFAQFVTPEVVTKRVEDRLKKVAQSKQPFFWHVFYSCNHLPYRSPEPYRSLFSDPNYSGKNRNGVDFDIDEFIGGTDLEAKWQALPAAEIQQIRALYDGCTRQFDDCVKRILAELDAQGLAERTIVMISADHGDDLYEPGVTLGHGLTFNGGLQANHVPLIVHLPGADPQVIAELVRTIDVAPTIADLVGVKKPPEWEGQSVAAWLTQDEEPQWRPFYGETGFPFIQFRVPGVERPHLPPMDQMTFIDKSFGYQFVMSPNFQQRVIDAKQRCLRTRYWKAVCTPTASGERHYQLFHLGHDPHAERDLAAQRPAVLAAMQTALNRWIDDRQETPIAEIFPQGEPRE